MRNKLVTIFASHQDSFIVTQNSSSVYKFRKTGSGQILQPRQLYLSPVPIAIGMAKIAPWCLARQDNFLAKVPGLVSADGATKAFCSYPPCRYYYEKYFFTLIAVLTLNGISPQLLLRILYFLQLIKLMDISVCCRITYIENDQQ